MGSSLSSIVSGCKKRRPADQKRLYDLFAPKMMAVCYRYGRTAEEAHDMMQEGFIKVFENIGKFQDRGSLEGWVRRIMVNTAIDLIRKNRHYHQQLEVQEGLAPDPSADALDDLQAEELMEVIQSLPDGYRMVFNLYAIEGYSHAEIGKKLDISESTSRSQYTRARSLLKKLVLDLYQERFSYSDVV
ncbi:sigma-70 family RNA polymerase sigma factor [Pontibacter sp. G13]|uniref:RNA polymerase sigma factor n=1 Tax=Pontibacter sp. G13 TaxID=3074898 RepID=UPI00288A494C|nr:sigma-70 family RNA polymerase sigma factor [Pontibacter sp. G13]WNJ17225.1 sigma-70 family RNA polymerase sigma factor [Pontibacter sp. G13]